MENKSSKLIITDLRNPDFPSLKIDDLEEGECFIHLSQPEKIMMKIFPSAAYGCDVNAICLNNARPQQFSNFHDLKRITATLTVLGLK